MGAAHVVLRLIDAVPGVAWLNIDRYTVVGGCLTGVVVGCVAGAISAIFFRSIRKGILKLADSIEGSEKIQSLVTRIGDHKAVKVLKNPLVRKSVTFFIGKFPELNLAQLREDFEAPPRILRRGFVYLATGSIVVLLLLEFIFFPFYLRSSIEYVLGRWNGAEVDLKAAECSLLSGSLAMRGLAMTNPKDPSRNELAAETVQGNLSVSQLLKKRFHIEELVVSGITTDGKRETPGKVYPAVSVEEKQEQPPPPAKKEKTPIDTGKWLGRIEDVINNWDVWKARVKKGEQWLKKLYTIWRTRQKLRTLGDPRKQLEYLRKQGMAIEYNALSCRTAAEKTPTFLLQKMVIPCSFASANKQPWELHLANVGSDLPLLPDAPRIELLQNGKTPLCTLTLSRNIDEPAQLRIVMDGIDLQKFVKNGSWNERFEKVAGTGVVELTGTWLRDNLDLRGRLDIQNLVLKLKDGTKLFKMSPELSQDIVSAITSLTFTFHVYGPLDDLKVEADLDEIYSRIKDTLKKQKKELLLKKMDEAWQKQKAKATQKVEKRVSREIEERYGEKIDKVLGKGSSKKVSKVAGKIAGQGGSGLLESVKKGTLNILSKKKESEQKPDKESPKAGKAKDRKEAEEKEEEKPANKLKKVFKLFD